MTSDKRKEQHFNENWEAEMAEYDAECEAEQREYTRKHVVFDNGGSSELTPEENEVFGMVLRGIPLSEIAEQAGVDEGDIYGLVEIIRAKLSLSE